MAQNPYLMNQIAQGFNFNPGGAFMQGQQDRMAMIAAQYQQQLAQMQMAQAQAQAERQKAADDANRLLAGSMGLAPELSVLGPQGMVQARNAIAPPFQPYQAARIEKGPDGKPIEVKYEVTDGSGRERIIGYESLGGGGVVVNTGDKAPTAWRGEPSETKRLIEDRYQEAEQAYGGLQAVRRARTALDSGMFTGFGADARLTGAKLLRWISNGEIDKYTEAVANTEQFKGETGVLVGQVIKLFGSGTGLSDADRQYAQQIAGALISNEPEAARRLLDSQENTFMRRLEQFNRFIQPYQGYEDFSYQPYNLEPPKQNNGGGEYYYNPQTGQLEQR